MQEREGDRIKDGLQVEMREREKDGGKEEGEEGWREEERNKEKENERRKEGRNKKRQSKKKKKNCLYVILAKYLPVTQEGSTSWVGLL